MTIVRWMNPETGSVDTKENWEAEGFKPEECGLIEVIPCEHNFNYGDWTELNDSSVKRYLVDAIKENGCREYILSSDDIDRYAEYCGLNSHVSSALAQEVFEALREVEE